MAVSRRKRIFNSKDAIVLAAMCFQTYQLYEKSKLVLPKGFKLRHTIRAGAAEEKKEVFGFIAESKDRVVVAFRGSDSLQDLVSDVNVFQVRYPFVERAGKTHRGVTSIYETTRNRLIKEVQKLSTRKKLFITGHSLGGALATLFALDVAVNTKFKKPIVYTLASFRVGNPAFVSRFNSKVKNSVRIYNVHDPIPFYFVNPLYILPFTKKGLVYRHVQRKVRLFFIPFNHKIECYFHHVSKKNPVFSKAIRTANPGFCPSTGKC